MNTFSSAAFYSDPVVEEIIERLYERWEAAGHRGEPVDYASDEELREMLRLAEHYARMPPWKAARLVEERRLRGGDGG